MPGSQPYKDRTWLPQPEAETVLSDHIETLIQTCPKAKAFRRNLRENCGIRLRDVIDHISFQDRNLIARLEKAGWSKVSDNVWSNPNGLFPEFVRDDTIPTIWMRVENAALFALTHDVANSIEGPEHGPARRLRVWDTKESGFGVYERNGYQGFDIPSSSPELTLLSRRHLQAFRARRREFSSPAQGLDHTDTLVTRAVLDIGPHWACDLWFKAEREYWQRRCSAGRRQKNKQDSMGVGWNNIDHHTYDGSREHFRHTITILEKLGYELREMLYAGELAGWGSQVLEQPVLKSTIFADVDLSPDELEVDFAHDELPPLPKHRRAGLVSAMHGESILQAGLNHVAGLYDRRQLNKILAQDGVEFMAPFSDFNVLYQELTLGDWGAVDPLRIDELERLGHLTQTAADEVRLSGAIMTHLENIERNFGYKGFNKIGIDGVLRKLDPRAYEKKA